MGNTRLAVQNGAEVAKLANHFTLENFLAAGAFLTHESTDPADVTHGGFYALDMELIFQTDRQAVQRPNWAFVLSIVFIELLRVSDGSVEKYFMQTVGLYV